jgi:hypothetical protein
MFGLQMAFEYFGGVPRVIFFDNMKQVVDENRGKEAKINNYFQKFADHYGFEIQIVNRDSGFRKSEIENLCNKVRLLLQDIPPVSFLSEVQDYLYKKLAYHRADSVMEKPMLDREMLNPLPKRRFLVGVCFDIIETDDLKFSYDTRE